MRGPEDVGRLVAARLQIAMGPKLTELETRLGLPVVVPPILPPPRTIRPHETGPLSPANDYPALIVVPQDVAVALEALGDTPDGDTYSVTYRVRVFALVHSDAGDHEQTALLRDRYALALREVILGRLRLEAGARIDRLTYRESYSGVDRAGPRDARTISGAYAEFTVTLVETLAVGALGAGTDRTLTVQPLAL